MVSPQKLKKKKKSNYERPWLLWLFLSVWFGLLSVLVWAALFLSHGFTLLCLFLSLFSPLEVSFVCFSVSLRLSNSLSLSHDTYSARDT